MKTQSRNFGRRTSHFNGNGRAAAKKAIITNGHAHASAKQTGVSDQQVGKKASSGTAATAKKDTAGKNSRVSLSTTDRATAKKADDSFGNKACTANLRSPGRTFSSATVSAR